MATKIRFGGFAMMGEQTGSQPKIFYPHLNLEQRVPRTHVLRRLQEQIDFNFIYSEVRDTYGSKGNVSIPPPVILKMMLLLVLYNVRSGRELMETIPMRLDWLWFLGYDIDSEVPDHRGGLWGQIFILDFAYILRKFPSDLRLFPLKTKNYIHHHPHD